MARIAVLTPTLPERAGMLAELRTDLAAQTYRYFTHCVSQDVAREGPATVRNRLAAQVHAEWLAFVDDDDRIAPNHLAVLVELMVTSGADVCYTACDVVGNDGWGPGHDCSHGQLEARNSIPVTALVRRSMFDRVGGFPADRDEDWGLWKAIGRVGGSFACSHEITWTYRFHGANRSREGC